MPIRNNAAFFRRLWSNRNRVAKGSLVCVLGICSFGTIPFVSAQETGAVILGAITDSNGGVLSSVNVVVTNRETGLTRSALTGAEGDYRIPGLAPGTYRLKAELAGFSTADVNEITLTIGLELRKDLSLKVGTVQEEITVSSDAPLTDTTNSQVGTAVIAQQQIDSLPIPARQTTQLSLLLPGTGTDSTRAKRPNANVGAGNAGLYANELSGGRPDEHDLPRRGPAR